MSSRAVSRRASIALRQTAALRRTLNGVNCFQARLPVIATTASQQRQVFDACGPRWFSSETEKKEDAAEEEKPEEQATADTPAEESEPVEEEEDPVAKLEGEVKELKDQLLRSLAEQDNTRRIAQQDVNAARQFAVQSFAKSLLEVSDNLTLALKSVPEESKDSDVLKTLVEGIEMTERGLMKAFEKNGLVKYGQVGDEFDPNKHSALFEYPDEEKAAGSVGQVIKSGFMLNNRVLRPAEVGVVKGE